jgi:hypothetical protein
VIIRRSDGREVVFQLRDTHSSTDPLISDPHELARLPIRDWLALATQSIGLDKISH